MKRQSGFTLIELLVAVAIMSILLVIGLPSYKYITSSYRMSAEANDLLGDLQYTQGEAIREGQFVTVCASNATQTACSGGTSWASGWIVFPNPTNAAQPAAVNLIMRVHKAFLGTTPDTFVASGGVSQITYNREGFATTAAGFPNTTITLHNPTAATAYTRCVWITPVGLGQVETPANNLSATCT
jgi:type IV fimbrial biogenesis protein FimT